MTIGVVERGEGHEQYRARGSTMYFKAVADQDDGDFSLMERTLPAGGRAHTFGNGGEDEARLLVIHAPAMDTYFAGLHELWNRSEPPPPDEERALMSRFGMEPV